MGVCAHQKGSIIAGGSRFRALRLIVLLSRAEYFVIANYCKS